MKNLLKTLVIVGLLYPAMGALVKPVYAQGLLPNAQQTFLDDDGNPLAAGYVYMYVPGTTTPKTTWQDRNFTTSNTNPIVLDSAGRARIWGDGAYRQIVQDSLGNTVWDQITQLNGNIPTVDSNADLKAFAVQEGAVIRLGYTTAGDGGLALYNWSSSPCSIASGAGDNGAQVDPTDGVGCWVADFTGTKPTPKIWGAAGDGVADDTAEVQAAMDALWGASSGTPLYVGTGKYLITTGLTSANYAILIGNDGPITPYATSCPTGLMTNSNINLMTLTGLTATVKNVCFQMATAAGTRTSGYALKAGGTLTTQQGHAQIIGNTVVFGYDGILIGGATTGATQTNGTLAADNLIISASNEGIAIGREGTEGSTPGTTLRDNQVVCYTANTAATGIALYDGALRYYGSDSGPYGCNIGLAIKPGTVGGARQLALGQFDGVLGDSSITADLDVNTTSTIAAAFYLKFVNAWAASISATDTPVRIRNTGGGILKNLVFSGGIFHSGASQTTPIFDIQAGNSITITGNHIVADGGGTTTGPGIKVASGVENLTITGNTLSGFNGTLATGIQLPSSGPGTGVWTITGNALLAGTTTISYTPNGETVVIKDNVGIDNICPDVTDGASITFPATANCFNLRGVTTITGITNSSWSNREVDVIVSSDGSKTINASNAPLCGSTNLTLAVGESAKLKWYNGASCWRVL